MPCPSTQIYHSQAFIGEVWAWTVLGILIFVARFAVRLRILPWRDLQGDDYMAIVTLVFFLGCIFCKLAIYYLGANSDYTEEEMLQLIDCQKSRLIIGSKFQVCKFLLPSSDDHYCSHVITDTLLVYIRILSVEPESNGALFLPPPTTKTFTTSTTHDLHRIMRTHLCCCHSYHLLQLLAISPELGHNSLSSSSMHGSNTELLHDIHFQRCNGRRHTYSGITTAVAA